MAFGTFWIRFRENAATAWGTRERERRPRGGIAKETEASNRSVGWGELGRRSSDAEDARDEDGGVEGRNRGTKRGRREQPRRGEKQVEEQRQIDEERGRSASWY